MADAILIVTLSSEVRELCTEIQERLPECILMSTTLRETDGIKNSMESLKSEGVTLVIVVPVFVLDGEIYRRAVNEVKRYAEDTDLAILPPIISAEDDFNRIVQIVSDDGETTVYCMHKSSVHIATDKIIWQMGETCGEVTAGLKAENITSVTLQPLTIGLGYHFKRDIIGKLKEELEKAGIAAKVIPKGLMDYKTVRDIITERIVSNKCRLHLHKDQED
jgi:cobalamin biosynthesis Co2+ chelatase CbiK